MIYFEFAIIVVLFYVCHSWWSTIKEKDERMLFMKSEYELVQARNAQLMLENARLKAVHGAAKAIRFQSGRCIEAANGQNLTALSEAVKNCTI